MLSRQILKYIPSLILPASAAFFGIYTYTRLLTPEQFGVYSLTINIVSILIAVFYYWLQTALQRLLPEAQREGREEQLHTTAYTAYAVVSLLLLIVMMVFIRFTQGHGLLIALVLAMPFAIVRALLNINQVIHRSRIHINRYNLIECGQAITGLLAGLCFVWFWGAGAFGAICGAILGMCCFALLDIRMLTSLKREQFNADTLKCIMRFGLPLLVSYGFSIFISVSDRFFIEHYYGLGQVGVYSAGYGLIDRINQIIFMLVAMPCFPLTIKILETQGVEAARQQTYHNAVALLLIALPATTGLMLLSPQLALVLIGEEFRAGAMQVMPWIAFGAMLGGFSTHFLDHAYHFGKKTHMLVYTLGPAALLNLILNFTLIPAYGNMGAVYATVASYVLLVTMNAFIGRRAFSLRFPLYTACKIAIACAAMAACLFFAPFPAGLTGLVGQVICGGLVYAFAVWLLNVENIRSRGMDVVKKAMGK